ncbi:MAG: single-stranded-DNA-specific exonuclease RecJ [Chloroflexi bacterium]|nr:single-stranded-DNA-specific exonuclease RecJ [Chloroflexota bacterium]
MAALQKRWEILPPAPEEHLASCPDVPPLIMQLLYNRQIRTPDEVRAFLTRSFAVDNPFLLKGMNEAVARLRQAIRAGEAIAVYGDYDVDGVAATALLVSVLRALGAQAMPYIPNRMDEGYGLNIPALKTLADQGIRLVITVDCGVRSIQEAAFARKRGLDLIITDHHAVGEELPPAVAIIDPRREDDRYPFKHLAGVGLAFKLAQALLRAESRVPVSKAKVLPQEEELLDLVALGTVADLAPLIGENRALVCRGLEQLQKRQRPGIAAMLEEAGLQPEQVDATAIGFVLGPRLNAAGRLDHAMASYKLLTTPSIEEAVRLAQQLGAQNRERQQRMNEMVEMARQEVLALGDDLIYILAHPAYTVGIAGLVASRITEEFYRPTLVIALEEGQSKGSARSISAFHITKALDECKDLLVKHGGHAAAAGFTICNDKLDAFRARLREIAARQLTPQDLLPSLKIDATLPLTQANGKTLALIEELQPFGVGNPKPTFLSYNVRVRDSRPISTERGGVKLKLSDGVAIWDAIAFQEIAAQNLSERIDVVYTLQSNTWNGRRWIELVVKDLRPATTKSE